LIERVIAPASWQALAQVPCHNKLDSPIDLQKAVVCTQAQHHSDTNRDRNQECRNAPAANALGHGEIL
jgi:hypothetical protein